MKMWKKEGYSAIERIWMDRLRKYSASNLSIARLIDHCSSIRKAYGNDSAAVFAESFIAPSYIPYVKWILQDAKNRGLKKLYFLNRDGYILWKIAEVINNKDIDLEYLFLSRRILSIPFLKDGDRDRFNLITGLSGEYYVWRVSVDDIAFRLNMTKEDLSKAYSLRCEDDMSKSEINRLVDEIFACRPLMRKLKYDGDGQFSLLRKYLEQAGILENPNICGIVDVGWTGTSRAMLSMLLQDMGVDESPVWYYFGADDNSLSETYGKYVSYTGSKYKTEPIVPLLENYFSLCPYGSVRSLRLSADGEVIPVLSDGPSDKQQNIIDINIKICTLISTVFNNCELDESIGREWADISLDSLMEYTCKDIDYSVLRHGKNYEGEPLVSKMKLKDMMRFCLSVPSDMDRLNVYYSFHPLTARYLLGLSGFVYKCRWLIKHYLHC